MHTDTSITYNLETPVPQTKTLQHGLSDADLPLVLSPERTAIYGDKEWRLSMLKAVEHAVSYIPLTCSRAYGICP